MDVDGVSLRVYDCAGQVNVLQSVGTVLGLLRSTCRRPGRSLLVVLLHDEKATSKLLGDTGLL